MGRYFDGGQNIWVTIYYMTIVKTLCTTRELTYEIFVETFTHSITPDGSEEDLCAYIPRGYNNNNIYLLIEYRHLTRVCFV